MMDYQDTRRASARCCFIAYMAQAADMEGSNIMEAAAPAPAELIARARAMIPALASRAREQQRQRAILPETIADLHAAGFFRVLQPKRWGGYEMDLGTFYHIEIALGEADMSTGW